MTTPTTDNPYILFLAEPPDWHSNGNTKPWEDHKKEVQTNNGVWLSKRTEGGNYKHQTDTPLNIEGSGFPLGLGNRYGPFIYAPLPLDGVTRWGFQREEGLAQFLEDVAKNELPKGGAVPVTPKLVKPVAAAKAAEPDPFGALTDDAPAEDDPFAALTGDAPAAAEPEADPFADLDMGVSAAPEPEEDPFASLDMGAAPITEVVVPDPVPEPPAAPPSPPPVADSVADEEETDEWGMVIPKADPFADL